MKRCEEELSRGGQFEGQFIDNNVALLNLSRCARYGGIDDIDVIINIDHIIYDTLEDYLLKEKGFSLGTILAELKSLGLSDENIERLKGTSLKHAYYVFNKLKK